MKEKDELLDHNYDGIQEYDNDLPRWWVALFWGGIIFGVFYVGYFHFAGGKFTTELIAAEMKKIDEQKAVAQEAAPKEESSRESLLVLASDQQALSAGQEVFIAKCAACHLEKGQGLVGPNLTDDYWIHGGDITDIKTVIVNGVLDKGMIAWGPLLKPEEVNQVTAYVWSINGTNPPNPKAPQGDLVSRSSLTGVAPSTEEAASEDAATDGEVDVTSDSAEEAQQG